MQKHYKLIAGLLVCVLGVGLEAAADESVGIHLRKDSSQEPLQVRLLRSPELTAQWFGDKYIITIEDMLENGRRCYDVISFSKFMEDISKAKLQKKYWHWKCRGVWFVVVGATTYFGEISDREPSPLVYSCSSLFFNGQQDLENECCDGAFQSSFYIRQLINVEVKDRHIYTIPYEIPVADSAPGSSFGTGRFSPRKFLRTGISLGNCCKTIDEKFFVHGTTALHVLQFLNESRKVYKNISFKNEKEFMDFIVQAALMHPYNSFQVGTKDYSDKIKFFSLKGSVYEYNPHKKALVKLPTLKTSPSVAKYFTDLHEGLFQVSED